MLRIRVTSGSQVAIATTHTAQYQMPAPASQNRPNITRIHGKKARHLVGAAGDEAFMRHRVVAVACA